MYRAYNLAENHDKAWLAQAILRILAFVMCTLKPKQLKTAWFILYIQIWFECRRNLSKWFLAQSRIFFEMYYSLKIISIKIKEYCALLVYVMLQFEIEPPTTTTHTHTWTMQESQNTGKPQ